MRTAPCEWPGANRTTETSAETKKKDTTKDEKVPTRKPATRRPIHRPKAGPVTHGYGKSGGCEIWDWVWVKCVWVRALACARASAEKGFLPTTNSQNLSPTQNQSSWPSTLLWSPRCRRRLGSATPIKDFINCCSPRFVVEPTARRYLHVNWINRDD